MIPALEVKQIRRKWCITAGKATLASHCTEEAAHEDLDSNRSLYQYWAGSASASVQNRTPRIVHIGAEATQ
ncbi:hypothetical protein ACPCHQ_21730 [Ralstonia thomasii]|uniref:hypothetical protein n=1 Tax=Ralstonia thomasii TaxID=3058596 RepID=UPI003C2F2198